MNIFLLGNGFDLHHKFPTSYIDFLHTVKFLSDKYDDSTMDTAAKVFGDVRLSSKCKNIANSFSVYEHFYKSILLDTDKIDFLVEKAKSNIWFKYFSTAIDKELTWIDFEKEIGLVIKCFNIFFDLMGKSIEDEYSKYVFILLQFSFFSKIEKQDFDWIYFWNVDEIKESYIKENPIGSNMYEIDKEKIIVELYNSLREFADMLKTYLKVFIDALVEEMNEQGFSIRNHTYPPMHCAFTFNYTNTIEKLYASNSDVCHLHGNVDTDIVLGVNPNEYDEFGNIDTSFICFKKYFQRVFFKTDVEYLNKVLAWKKSQQVLSQITNEKNVYIIGHSLDETDKDVIQEIFEFATKITIYYHQIEKVGDYIKNLVSIYGKTGFDMLRTTKNLEFLPHEESEIYHS